MLCLIQSRRKDAALRNQAWRAGNWRAALALFGYMACFSWAYVRLSAAAGALVIAVAVQAGMLAAGIALGQRPDRAQAFGIILAMTGLVYLLLPGLDAPPAGPAAVIFCSGAFWALYTICGRNSSDAVAATAGNFIRCVPLAALLLPGEMLAGNLTLLPSVNSGMPGEGAFFTGLLAALPWSGVCCALAAGALASALGYVLWYAALRRLSVPSAAVVQLSVPLITATGGALLMGEALTLRLLVSALAIMGGIFCATALAFFRTRR